MNPTLDQQFQAADPARHLTGYAPQHCQLVAQRIIANEALNTTGSEHPAVPKRRTTRSWRLAGATAAAVAALLVLPVIAIGGNVLGGNGASAHAAQVLNQAAQAASNAIDPPIRPDQYWKLTSKGSDLDTTVSQQLAGGSSTYRVGTESITYLAADGNRPSWEVSKNHTFAEHVAGARNPQEENAPTTTSSRTSNVAPNQIPASWQSPNPAFLAGLPRDTQDLRERLYADSEGQGSSPDGEALVYVADLLRSGMVPADLRAALYRVLTTVEGVEVTNDVVTVEGARGVSLGRTEGEGGHRQEIVIDPATGAYLGERSIESGSAGEVVTTHTVLRTVVDTVPHDVQRDAKREICRVEKATLHTDSLTGRLKKLVGLGEHTQEVTTVVC